MKTYKLAIVVALLLAISVSGCFKMHFVNGRRGGVPSNQANGKWHFSLVGVLDLSGPYTIEDLCPAGVQEVYVETSFLNSLVAGAVAAVPAIATQNVAFQLPILRIQTVTVKCAGGAKYDLQFDKTGKIKRVIPAKD